MKSVVPIHIFLKVNLKRVTLTCVPREPHPRDRGLEFRADTCSCFPSELGNPVVGWRKVEHWRGHVDWWLLTSAVPWPPPRTVIPLGWKKISKCKFPESFFSMEQHFPTVYSPFIFGQYLFLQFHNRHVERERSRKRGGRYIFHPATNKQSHLKEKPLCS